MQDNISLCVFDLRNTTLQSLRIDRQACIYDVLLTEPQNYIPISQSDVWRCADKVDNSSEFLHSASVTFTALLGFNVIYSMYILPHRK
jgi:hypothetical protein